jgi:tRNA(Ile)-lysidine synthase
VTFSERLAVSDAEFRALMGRLGEFEKNPTVAIAVSGGADSMALAVLANRWSKQRRGKIVALTVDHGLRAGSRAEANEAHRRLVGRGIDCQLLVWRGDKPKSGIQAAARDARYRLMAQWCRRHGVLHLLVAHHREDQAETILHRLARASGVDGLAGMAAIHELPDVRLLRPCLSLPRDRLRAVLLKHKIDWAEDPSNEDRGYARVRLRALLPDLASEGMNATALSGTALRMAGARASLEADTADFLGAHAAIFPEGYAKFDRVAFSAVDPEIARRVMIALITTIGGKIYPPRQARLETLCRDIRQQVGEATLSRARTLGGCRIVPAGADFLICREVGRCEVLTVPQDASVLWDNRFIVRLPGDGSQPARRYTIKALGETGWAEIRRKITIPVAANLPKAVRLALPAIHKSRSIVAVPHLEYYNVSSFSDADVQFMPNKAATSAGFPVV